MSHSISVDGGSVTNPKGPAWADMSALTLGLLCFFVAYYRYGERDVIVNPRGHKMFWGLVGMGVLDIALGLAGGR